ncbi:MAG: (d)CMP kinase [Gemmatimonadales bacterium]
MNRRVIAIDGPAASGKSSTAAAVARALDAHHLDSGALYRGLTRVALDAGTREAPRILAEAEGRGLELRHDGPEIVPYLDARPAEPVIRSPEVTAAVSEIAALAALRDWVNERLREAAVGERLLVLDGRDIGTAVFPDAAVKIYLTASAEARARRRLVQRGELFDTDQVAAEAVRLAARDRADAGRDVAPLRRAPDAVAVDTTDLGFREQVDRIVELARKVLSPKDF